MATRNERLVENQQMVRSANERLQALTDNDGTDERLVPFLCECADADCLGRIPLTSGEYDEIHVDRDLYVILRGHQLADGEEIADRRDGFDITRKND